MRKKLKKILVPLMFTGLAVLTAGEWLSGCVPLSQNVQVQAPSAIQTDASGQDVNTLNRCDPHVYPYQVIRAVTSASTSLAGGNLVADNQTDFDSIWIQVSGVLDNQNVPTSALKPAVDWNSQEVNFMPFHLRSTCEHIEPTGMSTDCLTVSIVFSHWTDMNTQNCQPEDIYPVYIFIYPRSSLHVASQVNERPPSGS